MTRPHISRSRSRSRSFKKYRWSFTPWSRSLVKFDDLVDNPITFTPRKNPSTAETKRVSVKNPSYPLKLNKGKKHNKESLIKKIKNKKVINSKLCKFVSSFGPNEFSCPKDYPVHTGASFGIRGSGVSCNGDKINSKRAKAIATIKDGQISRIIITSRGTNYATSPPVKIIGDGRLASAYALIKNGSVHKVVINNPGVGYKSTPTIKIGKPNSVTNCNLCCKNEL